MSTERDELADLLADSIFRYTGVTTSSSKSMADELLTEGYRKPQQVTTVEELDEAVLVAFEEGQHLVLSDRHARPWIIWSDEDGDEQVNSWPQEEDPDPLALGDIDLPATVLHVGGAE